MSARAIFNSTGSEADGTHWLSVSDLMAGLMMIFLFIAVSHMRSVKEIVVLANETRGDIYAALDKEFKEDLSRWNAELDRESMTVRFKEPDILFGQSSATLKPQFQEILNDFFPRYVKVLRSYSDAIDEIRIEGHTSSEWREDVSEVDGYFRNMVLSQQRTNAVLEYCYRLPAIETSQDWIKSRIAAVGLSSSRLVNDANGVENRDRSRRVEFTVKTNFERRIIKAVIG